MPKALDGRTCIEQDKHLLEIGKLEIEDCEGHRLDVVRFLMPPTIVPDNQKELDTIASAFKFLEASKKEIEEKIQEMIDLESILSEQKISKGRTKDNFLERHKEVLFKLKIISEVTHYLRLYIGQCEKLQEETAPSKQEGAALYP